MKANDLTEQQKTTDDVIEIGEILRRLPHRYPFLLIDRAIDYIPNKSIRGIKNVTINEPFFPGHFPGAPVMPGVLQIEALAQTGAVLMSKTLNADITKHLILFMSVENARFKKPVMPGDQLHLHVEIERHMRGVWKFKAEARVDGQLVAEARLMSAKRDI